MERHSLVPILRTGGNSWRHLRLLRLLRIVQWFHYWLHFYGRGLGLQLGCLLLIRRRWGLRLRQRLWPLRRRMLLPRLW
jgi:hypothetical protein